MTMPRPTSPRDSLGWLRWWADVLDSRFRIPGTSITFGLDPLLAFIPGFGDLASPAFAVALMAQALGQRVPPVILLRMLLNSLFDALIGAVPLAGPIVDVFWRANLRNLRLLETHSVPGVRPRRGDYVFVLAMVALFGMLAFLPVILGLWLARRLWSWA
jgi:hypothetical protein